MKDQQVNVKIKHFMVCLHYRDVITVFEMDALNYYVSILLLSASGFKFMKFII